MIFLVVDDEALARRDLARVLKRVEKDATVHEAESAATALEICSKQNIDVVFLDIHMPGTDGLSLAKEMLRIAPHTNIIMVTAYPDYALEAHRLFVSGYILKPAMEDDVREALNHLRFNMGGASALQIRGSLCSVFWQF